MADGPPQRLDARNREGRASGEPAGSALPPRRLDAPRLVRPPGGAPAGTGSDAPSGPPRRLDAPGRARRDEPAEPPPPAAPPAAPPSEIPALWGTPGGRPSEPAAGAAQVRRGQSIATYKRPELVEIVGRIAAREPDLSDDQLIELVTRILGCPEDEELLVGARLRYAVEMYRKQTGRGDAEQ
ncbi:hypothetical protein [Actinomadura sp. 6K520]|uniref:hypothetical protein n=1 Tax=Actinomadura sp. 6K520 TaxID=2530364 RepID=UPI0010527F89|nr:hypothetical protein [Actinomadura sp. 6K520]TDE18810.1 hypothetical protein E1289_34825 [Actinomadura sp. 6K520]